MATNPTPDNTDVLLALADRMADGCHLYEVTLGILQNTEAVIRAAITAVTAAELDVGFKKAAVSASYNSLQTADEIGRVTLTNCKLRLSQKLGQRWNADWEPTGFPSSSTAVPDTQDERFTLLASLKNYFTALAGNESAEMGATAALCDAAWISLSDGRQLVAENEANMNTAQTARTTAITSLRKRVRGLISELETLIADDTPRWESFGLNIPANPTAPESVASVTATALGNGRIDVSWPYATRATRYRVETFIIGVDTVWQNKASAKDLEIILKNFTAGQQVKARITSGNDGGDAAPSPEATVTVA